MTDIKAIFNRLISNVESDEIKLLIKENFLELSVPELKYITLFRTIESASRICNALKKERQNHINSTIKYCNNEKNLKELKKAIKFGQRNLLVLEMIANSKTPYEIRKGFELGSKLTIENIYGRGYPAFNYLIAENANIYLPDYIPILLENGEIVSNEKFKSKRLLKNTVIL